MNPTPLDDLVAQQYARWTYPEPIVDLPAWLSCNWQWFDPSHSQLLFWPDRDPGQDLDILIAGCGTNQAAVFAYNNPGSRVLAIDVSDPSLEHHAFLRDRYGLRNLDILRLPIEQLASLDRSFDLIVSTGVLHHMADPVAGASCLAACLRPNGVLALMFYAHYGRIGVEMMQAVFRELGLQQNEASLLMVREALAGLAADHPLKPYLSLARDLNFDSGLVDTFLHGRDRSYTVDDCLELLDAAGLCLQDWLFKSLYHATPVANQAFMSAVAALPERQQWSVMERINARNACHFLTACLPERSPDTYRIDFRSSQVLEYRPAFRFRCGLDGIYLVTPERRLQLDAIQLALVQPIDGRRSLREIAASAASTGVLPAEDCVEMESRTLRVFEWLWKTDVLAMRLPG
jgi:SAM-dependent methyltransferase